MSDGQRTDQDGAAADMRYLKDGCAAAIPPAPRPAHCAPLRGLRPDATAPALGGLGGQSIARRLTAAVRAASRGLMSASARNGVATNAHEREPSLTVSTPARGCCAGTRRNTPWSVTNDRLLRAITLLVC